MKEETEVEVLSAVLWHANSVIVSGWLYHIGIMYRIEIYNQSSYSPLSAQDSGGIIWFDIANGDYNMLSPFARIVVEQLVKKQIKLPNTLRALQ